MLNWLRKLLSPSNDASPPAPAPRPAEPDVEEDEECADAMRIDQLFVEPDSYADFDRDACERLLTRLEQLGATTIDEVQGLVVPLEDFFTGNRDKCSIAANVRPAPPYDTAQSWFELLKQIRATSGVTHVWVEIMQVEPYEDGRLGMWPFSDTVWIYSSLDRDKIAALVAPLEPDYVQDASLNDPNFDLKPPLPPEAGTRPYWIWWD